ncbi:restriction endonuclease subunit S [Helicobacter pylori]|uniref:restriction endonuclease subunit S n=1 Tax=Helicobacter pylori TaxID=210 RepID=UPI001EE8D6E0|nr:restriction endonuclease subunit S [Helicobacter pylori]
MFEASNGDFDIQKRHINHKGEFVITAGLSNNGVLGQSDIKAKVFESHTITIDMFGCAFYRSFPYKMVTHARVFSLKPKFEINHKIGLFLSTLFFGYPKKFGYENMCSWVKIKNDKVILPLKPTANTQTLEDIDFHFMEKFIAELEQCRLAELEAYLKATGLENTTLSSDEENALSVFNGNNSGGGNTPCGLTWQHFKLGDLFEKVSARFLGKGDKFKATSKSITDTHNIPLVYCKKGNSGIMYWGKKGDFETYNNIISIIYNGVIATGLTYAHRDEVGILAESYFIKFKNGNPNFLCNLFIKTAIEKVLYPKYSRDNLATWANKVENELIILPTNQHGGIDFDFMRTLINALMKQIIQGVVQYCDAKIQTTKEVINQETPVQKDSLF